MTRWGPQVQILSGVRNAPAQHPPDGGLSGILVEKDRTHTGEAMPQSTTLPVGETVDVKIRSAVVVTPDPLVVRAGTEDVQVPTGAEVEIVAPLHWPPLVGDVWKDGTGNKWFALTEVVNGEPKVRLISEDGGPLVNPQQVKTEFRPLTLEYRAS